MSEPLNTNQSEGLKNFQRGLELDAAGKTAEAVEVYRAAVTVCPDMAPAHFNLGLALALLGQRDQAIRSWRKAVWLDFNYRRELTKALGLDDELGETEMNPLGTSLQ